MPSSPLDGAGQLGHALELNPGGHLDYHERKLASPSSVYPTLDADSLHCLHLSPRR
jgi:hypothetical protein